MYRNNELFKMFYDFLEGRGGRN